MSELTKTEIEVIVDSLRYARRAADEASSPPEYKTKRLEQLDSILSKLAEMKKSIGR